MLLDRSNQVGWNCPVWKKCLSINVKGTIMSSMWQRCRECSLSFLTLWTSNEANRSLVKDEQNKCVKHKPVKLLLHKLVTEGNRMNN